MNIREIIEIVREHFPDKGDKEIINTINSVMLDMHMSTGKRTDLTFYPSGENFYYTFDNITSINSILKYKDVIVGNEYTSRLHDTPPELMYDSQSHEVESFIVGSSEEGSVIGL